MAFDASNNKADTNQVVSSTPLAGGQQPPAQQQQKDSQPVQATSQPATVQSGTSTEVQSQQNQQQSQQNTKKPSSGMFTNIQKYVQKNKPQAQKMASAVSTDVSNQAQEIGSQVEDKQQQMNQALQANQQNLDTQMDQARELVGQASGMEYDQNKGWNYDPNVIPEGEDPYALTEEQESQYQQYMEGPVGVSQVGGLNISEQQQRAEALQQLASQTNTESGRRALLGESFRDDGDYTSGMAGLDDLIVTGDATAREQMIQGVQQQANELQSQIETIGSEANKAKMAQDMAMRNFGTDVSNLSQEAADQIMRQVESEVETKKLAWENQLKILEQEAIDKFNQQGNVKYQNSDEFFQALLDQFTYGKSRQANRRTSAYRDSIMNAWKGGVDMYDHVNSLFRKTARKDPRFDYLNTDMILDRGGQTRMQTLVGDLVKQAKDYGIDTSKYVKDLQAIGKASSMKRDFGWAGTQDRSDLTNYRYNTEKFKGALDSIFNDIQNVRDNALERYVSNKYSDIYGDALGQDSTYEDFKSGDFFDNIGIATEDQAARIEALRNLTGQQTDPLGTELGEDAGIGTDTEFLLKLIRDYGLDPEDFGL